MLYGVLSVVLNMTLTASLVICVVLLIRLLLKRAPRVFSYALWAVVLFRLLCPVSVSSNLSLLGLFSVPVTEEHTVSYLPDRALSEADSASNVSTEGVATILPEQVEEEMDATRDVLMILLACLWLAGTMGLVSYSIWSLIRLKRQLRGSIRLRDNIYLTDRIDTPFVLGVSDPKIYLPASLKEHELDYIILHEETHIHRRDYLIKPLAFLAVSIHWFNPLVWVAWHLAIADMEQSCDEAVLKKLGEDIRADYSASLLRLATGTRMGTMSPLAFGEGETKARIKNVLRYKKPVLAATGALVVVTAILLLSLGTDPVSGLSKYKGMTLQDTDVSPYHHVEPVTEGSVLVVDTAFITKGGVLWVDSGDAGLSWNCIGGLEEDDLTADDLVWPSGVVSKEIANNLRQVWSAEDDDGSRYYLVELTDDTLLLLIRSGVHGMICCAEELEEYELESDWEKLFVLASAEAALAEQGLETKGVLQITDVYEQNGKILIEERGSSYAGRDWKFVWRPKQMLVGFTDNVYGGETVGAALFRYNREQGDWDLLRIDYLTEEDGRPVAAVLDYEEQWGRSLALDSFEEARKASYGYLYGATQFTLRSGIDRLETGEVLTVLGKGFLGELTLLNADQEVVWTTETESGVPFPYEEKQLEAIQTGLKEAGLDLEIILGTTRATIVDDTQWEFTSWTSGSDMGFSILLVELLEEGAVYTHLESHLYRDFLSQETPTLLRTCSIPNGEEKIELHLVLNGWDEARELCFAPNIEGMEDFVFNTKLGSPGLEIEEGSGTFWLVSQKGTEMDIPDLGYVISEAFPGAEHVTYIYTIP